MADRNLQRNPAGDAMLFKKRAKKTNYVSAGNTIACDVMLEIEINGKRYRLPAFEV